MNQKTKAILPLLIVLFALSTIAAGISFLFSQGLLANAEMQDVQGRVGVTLDDGIILKYVLNIPTATDENKPVMTFVSTDLGAVDGAEVAVTGERQADGTYLFAYDKVTPQYLDAKITATLTVGDEAVELPEKMINYSVTQYLDDLLVNQKGNVSFYEYDALKALVADLTNYGGAAQAYNQMPTTLTADGGTNYDTNNKNEASLTATTDENGATFTNVSVVFDSQAAIRYYVAIGNNDASEVRVKIGEKIYGLTKLGEDYYVTHRGIIATALDTAIEATLLVNKTVAQTANMSVGDYVAVITETSQNSDMVCLAQAIYTYGKSAENYALTSSKNYKDVTIAPTFIETGKIQAIANDGAGEVGATIALPALSVNDYYISSTETEYAFTAKEYDYQTTVGIVADNTLQIGEITYNNVTIHADKLAIGGKIAENLTGVYDVESNTYTLTVRDGQTANIDSIHAYGKASVTTAGGILNVTTTVAGAGVCVENGSARFNATTNVKVIDGDGVTAKHITVNCPLTIERNKRNAKDSQVVLGGTGINVGQDGSGSVTLNAPTEVKYFYTALGDWNGSTINLNDNFTATCSIYSQFVKDGAQTLVKKGRVITFAGQEFYNFDTADTVLYTTGEDFIVTLNGENDGYVVDVVKDYRATQTLTVTVTTMMPVTITSTTGATISIETEQNGFVIYDGYGDNHGATLSITGNIKFSIVNVGEKFFADSDDDDKNISCGINLENGTKLDVTNHTGTLYFKNWQYVIYSYMGILGKNNGESGTGEVLWPDGYSWDGYPSRPVNGKEWLTAENCDGYGNV